jgi:hypothetical protein
MVPIKNTGTGSRSITNLFGNNPDRPPNNHKAPRKKHRQLSSTVTALQSVHAIDKIFLLVVIFKNSNLCRYE